MITKKPYSQAARVQGILRTLGTRQGITIGELAEEFSVTKRTLYRDIKELEEAGPPGSAPYFISLLASVYSHRIVFLPLLLKPSKEIFLKCESFLILVSFP